MPYYAMALPLRCAASLRLAGKLFKFLRVSDPAVLDRLGFRASQRQVEDLPRIGAAEPVLKEPGFGYELKISVKALAYG
jgi:hypothetical protein